MAHSYAVAKPYARALFELAREQGALDGWSAFLATAATAAAEPALARQVDAPGADRERFAALIGDLCQRDPEAAAVAATAEASNFLRLLAENRRLAALPDIARAFEQLKADVENRLNVVLTAATAVDEAQQARIAEALKRRFGREVSLRFELDESLIGGARLRAEDHVIDGSVRTRLAKLASALVH
ncbi:MAG: F0F1 ATP synthase subunit delta [Gammaproteobacteria bacterium]|nr:MAG: F0F1 ATP synthase subunit delta [Gammaproteobacteria bacterium]